MRRLSSLVTALALGFAAATAQADVVLSIDDFNAPGATIFDTTPGDGAPIAGTGFYSDSVRTISHNLFSPGPNPADCTWSCVKFGANSFPTGQLKITNDTAADSEVKISWTVAAGFVPAVGAVNFFFQVIDSDGNPITADLAFNNTVIQSVIIPGNTSNTGLNFAINAANQGLLTGGGVLTLILNGVAGWDLAIDSFGVSLPEPTSLALVGLALVGAGVVSRRRKA